MIAIINHGLGNFRSIISAVEYLGENVLLTNNAIDIKKCKKLIIPGVGNFKYAMDNLNKLNLIDVLNEEVLVKNKSILGICLGCQLLLDSSEEGEDLNSNKKVKGLGWINGEVKLFKKNKNFPVTHVGWNEVSFIDDPIFSNMPKKVLMYFNHSYFTNIKDKSHIIGTTNYSTQFPSIFKKNNIYGIQPHPEKSQKFGINFLKNFIQNDS
jgi:imidazole glycerol-phosphate synthase subunit HisH